MSALRAFTRSYMVVLPDYPLPGHQNQGPYISNQAVNPFRPRTSTSEHYRQVPGSCLQVPGSYLRVWVPAPGSGSCLWLPASRSSDLSCLRINGNLPLIRPSESRAIHLQSGCESFQTEDKYIRALSTRKLNGTGYEPTSYSKYNNELDTMVKLKKSYEENHVISFRLPGSGFLPPGSGVLPSGLGPCPRHVYNSNYWLRPQSLAHQQGPSMLTEAPRHIMLTTAYRQENTLNDACPSSYHSVELGMDRLLNSSIFGNMEGSPYRKFSFSWGKGAVPCTGPKILHSGKPSLPLIARFCHRTRGITCALKSTGVAHSQQASLRQDIAPMEKLWFSDGVLETVEPGALTFPEEEL
ncbi:hypothetical protein F2Q69_00059540 [Brassica cretica]|uniref:Uncharacterized protein n=1 Tax=Brassica cretica TaxID=69181 RepID=A0A8S9RG12_BRACR|nr:hypothetical protein F2Q69_00059540 [Brassica cretica]